VVINSTGVWTDELQRLSGGAGGSGYGVKGVHLVVPRDRITSESGIILKTEKSVLVRHPVEIALDHRNHPTPTGISTSRTRLPRRPTSTTSSSTSTRCWRCR